MLNLAKHAKVRGSGHLVLNVLRAFTIIGLGGVMASCWIMVVMSGLTGQFYFFDAMSHLAVFFISVFLVLSEVNLFKRYFKRNWPVLSPTHSHAFLGLALVTIGCSVLGDLSKPAYSIDNLDLPMWRVIIASGVLSLTFGFFNLVAALIFRDSGNGITSRMIREDGNLASADKHSKGYYDNYSPGYSRRDDFSSRRTPSDAYRQKEETSGGRRDGMRAAAKRLSKVFDVGPLGRSKTDISKPIISRPMPVSDVESGGGGDDDQLSEDSRQSPILPDVQRPPSVLHPVHTNGSRYSAANMERF
ncbi:hypothetical protein QBC46DRAFT_1619 [Diplogelasinospora grovesii]|uniref:DUF7598 domain-containing protein n=1 Tax=Diplogelasinospora grovesii TaxID=303347 RepID=A0AAN6SA66_9PEZI|nr:hypothetical protein QBC46DRAFT_1619 [Diplogelasinospora grovesii]